MPDRLPLYRWKAKYSGMEVSEAKRLRELEKRLAAVTPDDQASSDA